MKRKHNQEYPYLCRHFGLFFWQKCECCGEEFRLEAGFRYLSGPFIGGAGKWKYLCGECAETRSVASALIKELAKPSAPPKACM